MKKMKISLENIQGKLNRSEMKNIMAGSGSSNGGGYMCCWTGTNNCSVCVPGGYPSCVAGATAVSC